MSFLIEKTDLDSNEEEFILNECTIIPNKTIFDENPIPIKIYKNMDNYISLPLGLWSYFYTFFPNSQSPSSFNFIGNLIEDSKKNQLDVANSALHQLYNKHTCLLALHTGFGKTITSIYLASKLKQKTLVIYYNTSILHKQWKETIERFTNAKLQIISGNIEIDDDANIYLIGLIKFLKSDIELNIGTVIIDEIHMILTQNYISILNKIQPYYLIGLSATPDKRNGTHKILYRFFGPFNEFIIKKETKNFTVIKYETDFIPLITFNKRGELDWSCVILSLALNDNRQDLIANIIKQYNDYNILVLSKRVCECVGCTNKCEHKKCKGIYSRLEDVESLIGNKKKYNNKRILIGTFAKIGVGFDDKSRNMLILCSDTIDVRQYEGRIRTEDCIIIDFVDNFSVLEKHWKNRKEWYLSKGATIKIIERKSQNIKRAFPKKIFSNNNHS